MELGMHRRTGLDQEVLSTARAARSAITPATRAGMGIYELLVMNDTLREMVVAEASLDDFRNACRKFGMRTLRETGMNMIHDGISSIEEILRETMLDDM